MTTTTLNTKCLLAARGPLRRRARLAHRPVRAAAGTLRGAAPAYTEAPLLCALPEAGVLLRPRVLHVDADPAAAAILASLLAPDADVVHAATLADARRLLAGGVYSLLVLDPALPDGDARLLLPMLSGTPLLVYATHQPQWRDASPSFLSKPWTSVRQLWSTMAAMLGAGAALSAGA